MIYDMSVLCCCLGLPPPFALYLDYLDSPCPVKYSLQAPVSDVDTRLRALLSDYPDHPVLMQLAAIAARCLALPATAPLKTALTGLELLLARAQV